MGNEKKEDAVGELENMLGLSDNKEQSQEQETKKDDKKEETPAVEEKEENTTKTTSVTDEQITINQDIAKIDVKIEVLQNQSVDTSEFYDNLENYLSEDEQALELSDRSAYMKLINTKAKEFEDKNSNSDELKTLEEEKTELQGIYERQSAIVEVSKKYPDYNHETILTYFNNSLSKNEQQKIYDASNSYAEVYENTYKKHLESNPANIETTPAPTIPNVKNVRKETPTNTELDDGNMSEDEKLQEALGL